MAPVFSVNGGRFGNRRGFFGNRCGLAEALNRFPNPAYGSRCPARGDYRERDDGFIC